MDISVFGIGYVGAVSAGCLARDGHRVTAVDMVASKVRDLNHGLSPIVEPGLEEILAASVQAGQLSATRSANKAIHVSDLSLVCVGTPSARNGSLDLGHLERVTTQIAMALRGKNAYHSVVYRSTVVPGTVDRILIPRLEQISGKKAGADFGVGYMPEFLREGMAIQDYDNPGVSVYGACDEITANRLKHLHDQKSISPVITDIAVAEAVKYACNAWHATKISFANEMGNICKALGLDGHEVMEIMCQDRKLNISSAYMKPGFAFGGSCLPKDLRALRFAAREREVATPVLDAVLTANEMQLMHAYNMIEACGKRRVGVLGLSFKPSTDDLRESPLVELVERLYGRGYAVKIYDPNIQIGKLTGTNLKYVRSRLPHVSTLLSNSLDRVLAHSEVIVVGNAALGRDALPMIDENKIIIDLVRTIARKTSQGTYRGLCW